MAVMVSVGFQLRIWNQPGDRSPGPLVREDLDQYSLWASLGGVFLEVNGDEKGYGKTGLVSWRAQHREGSKAIRYPDCRCGTTNCLKLPPAVLPHQCGLYPWTLDQNQPFSLKVPFGGIFYPSDRNGNKFSGVCRNLTETWLEESVYSKKGDLSAAPEETPAVDFKGRRLKILTLRTMLWFVMILSGTGGRRWCLDLKAGAVPPRGPSFPLTDPWVIDFIYQTGWEQRKIMLLIWTEKSPLFSSTVSEHHVRENTTE